MPCRLLPIKVAAGFRSAKRQHLLQFGLQRVVRLAHAAAVRRRAVKVIEGVVWFNYSVLDKGIYYIDRLGDKTRLPMLNFLTGKSSTVARNFGDVDAGLAETPDGGTVLFARMDSSADDLMLVENFR